MGAVNAGLAGWPFSENTPHTTGVGAFNGFQWDDYFNASAAIPPGNYLSSRWNIAQSTNQFIIRY